MSQNTLSRRNFMTGIAVRGLSECARLGYPVDAVALRRGRERLRAIAKEDSVDDRRAYAAYALGEPDEALIARFDELSVWAQALLVLSFPPEQEARAVALARKLVPRAEGGRWTSTGWTRREDLSVEATCYAIQALALGSVAFSATTGGRCFDAAVAAGQFADGQ